MTFEEWGVFPKFEERERERKFEGWLQIINLMFDGFVGALISYMISQFFWHMTFERSAGDALMPPI